MAKLHLFSDTAKQIGYYLPRNIIFVSFSDRQAIAQFSLVKLDEWIQKEREARTTSRASLSFSA